MNKLTPEQLDMIKRLQPFFRKIMKEWKDNDLCYCSDCDHRIKTYLKHSYNCIAEPLRIPTMYDWQNPERGLWGVVDWEKFYIKEHYSSIDAHKDTDEVLFRKYDLSTALLKALCEQEGV